VVVDLDREIEEVDDGKRRDVVGEAWSRLFGAGEF
jgi:hypothetical protein